MTMAFACLAELGRGNFLPHRSEPSSDAQKLALGRPLFFAIEKFKRYVPRLLLFCMLIEDRECINNHEKNGGCAVRL